MLEQKCLILGSSDHQYADCMEWGNEPILNIVDYDIVIVNVRSINNSFIKKAHPDYFKTLCKLFCRLLISNGKIIVLSDFKKAFESKIGSDVFRFNNYSWCPIDIKTEVESGDTIELIDNCYPKYFEKFNKWDYYFDFDDNCIKTEFKNSKKHSFSPFYKLEHESFIQNRYGKILSGKCYIEMYSVKKSTRGRPTHEKTKIKYKQVELIPLISEIDDREALNLLLEDIFGKPQHSLAPAWANDIKMPFIDNLESKISNYRNKIDDIEKKISINEEKKAELETYKKLLYTNGNELEDIFRKCLNELGATVDPAKYSDEEYCLVYKNNEYPVEAKGIAKSVSLTHLRQLIDYMLKYEEATETRSKGILLGNSWKNLPIEERGTDRTPNFPENVISRAKDMDIALVSSVEFFKAFCNFLGNKSIGNLILERMVDTSGVVDFSGLNIKKIK